MICEIAPRCGAAFTLAVGQHLKVIDPHGQQVSDMVVYNNDDHAEHLSNGRSIDYNDGIYLTTGHKLYSNRSNVMMDIAKDTVGRHDFLLAPCSAELFRIQYKDDHPHHGCHGNLADALAPHGIDGDRIPVAFNIFMNVAIHPDTGKIDVRPPLSKPGDHIVFTARMNLLVALTACSAGKTNNFSYKPIHYEIT
jgi:uncharacterized protein YcgI (DUF1989 family)